MVTKSGSRLIVVIKHKLWLIIVSKKYFFIYIQIDIIDLRYKSLPLINWRNFKKIEGYHNST